MKLGRHERDTRRRSRQWGELREVRQSCGTAGRAYGRAAGADAVPVRRSRRFGLPALRLLQHGLCRGPFGLNSHGMTMIAMGVSDSMVRMADMGLGN